MNPHNYRNWKTIPIPPRLQKLERDPRGYIIPFIVLRNPNNGEAFFQVNDDYKVEYAIAKDCCAVCGQKMDGDKWLVGGPLSAFHAQGCYIDTPTHQECLHYALKVCPYLAVPNYKKNLDLMDVIKRKDLPDHMVYSDPTLDDIRVPFFVAVHVRSFTVSRKGPGQRFLHPDKNYLAVEYWNEGVQIDENEALKLFREHEQNPKSGVK